MAVLWSHSEYPQFVPYVKRLEILRDDGDARLFYTQLSLPFVKDRDATMRTTRTQSPDTGAWEMTTVAAPDEGPPECETHVRIRMSISHWRLVPDGDGTAITYMLRTDAGGLVPDWVANAAQKIATTKLIRAVLDRAARQDR